MMLLYSIDACCCIGKESVLHIVSYLMSTFFYSLSSTLYYSLYLSFFQSNSLLTSNILSLDPT